MNRLLPITGLLFTLATLPIQAADMPHIRVADDGRSFVTEPGNQPFVPWGFNYDHDDDGTLLEDYWDEKWDTVVSAFHEMRDLKANVVRIHLQVGRFMRAANEPNPHALQQLTRLLRLAEDTGLYLDITGLGCYHKQDVPAWFDALPERERWAAQAAFWDAVSKTCSTSPAVFCYDLMNEPVVPGGDGRRDDWLGPAFGDKHFVQFIALDRAGRDRAAVAAEWIHVLVQAIRKNDRRHMITVGLVPWSLDRPGLTSGFVPERIAAELDFIAVHLYPEKGKVAEAMETLSGFAATGKPVIIEEMFTLKCGAEELEDFIRQSRKHAVGWIGFYWGRTPNEYRPPKSIGEAITLGWLELFERRPHESVPPTAAP